MTEISVETEKPEMTEETRNVTLTKFIKYHYQNSKGQYLRSKRILLKIGWHGKCYEVSRVEDLMLILSIEAKALMDRAKMNRIADEK